MRIASRGVLDTSVLVAQETRRQIDFDRVPDEVAISVVTLAELHLGIHTAPDIHTRTQRVRTLTGLGDTVVLDIDEGVALQFARLRAEVATAARRVNVNDLWIAATAAFHDLPVVTQDDDFDVLAEIGGLAVIHV